MRTRIAVLHWLPLEQYPPTTNLLTFFGHQKELEVRAYTTHNDKQLAPFQHPDVSVFRTFFPTVTLSRLKRAWAFLWFPLLTLWRLLWYRPSVLIYLEPHSAFAAWLYCAVNRRCRLFIHYHEYRDPKEYQEAGMRIVALFHSLEKRSLYFRAEWISHTNEDRVRMFLEDIPQVDETKMRTVANRPPASWFAANSVTWPDQQDVLKLVYVGAVSLKNTFIERLTDWVRNVAHLSLDIYTNNTDTETHAFLSAIDCDRIEYHKGGVAYNDLPDVLRQYHVGLILYRGTTRNYVFNAPNKLFEYQACGLDIWYPKQMEGIKPYTRNGVSPRVIEVDFEDDRTLPSVQDVRPPAQRCEISCESELTPIRDAIQNG